MVLFWLLLAIPLIEIALFIQVGGLIGLWPTLALVLLSAVAGAMLIRAQGARAMAEVSRSLTELRDPTRPIAHGALILLAGALLMSPGFFTDAIGLLLLVPPVREALIRRAGRNIRVTGMDFRPRNRREPHRPPFEDGVIDADYIVEPDLYPGPHSVPRPDAPRPDMPRGSAGATGVRAPSGWTRH